MAAFAFAPIPSGLFSPLFFVFLAGLLVMLLWSTIAERDRWPFSHHPMFGRATEANAVRFFILRVYFENGTSARLGGATDVLVDLFHREFERLWAAGPVSPDAADEVALRYWHEACRFDARLAPARRIEVLMRIGRLISVDSVVVGEKAVHAVPTGGGELGG